MNPELVLTDIATAIKHRTISDTFMWHIVFYHDRITCIPTYIDVPDEIILGTLSEQQALDGLPTLEWENLKTRVTKIYKELKA